MAEEVLLDKPIPYPELKDIILRPENCTYVVLQDLEFSSLNVDILLHAMNYEQLMKRLEEGKNG